MATAADARGEQHRVGGTQYVGAIWAASWAQVNGHKALTWGQKFELARAIARIYQRDEILPIQIG